jgi:hypothetical protein
MADAALAGILSSQGADFVFGKCRAAPIGIGKLNVIFFEFSK